MIRNAATCREAAISHALPRRQGPRSRIVAVGAGPGGLEAARAAGERRHSTLVLEAGSRSGGQIRPAAALKRRREIIGVVDRRMSECERHGVEFRFDAYAYAPDVVVTAGLPDVDVLAAGADLATSFWDLLSGSARPAASMILNDDGAHPGMTAAEFIAGSGAAVDVVTPERTLAPTSAARAFRPTSRR